MPWDATELLLHCPLRSSGVLNVEQLPSMRIWLIGASGGNWRFSGGSFRMTPDQLAPFLQRLRLPAGLSVQAIIRLPVAVKSMGRGQTVVATGNRPSSCCLIIEGFVHRSKTVDEGRREIFSFHQPGDIPDLQSLYLHVLDHDALLLMIVCWDSSRTIPYAACLEEVPRSPKHFGEIH